ncbi:MAG: imidazole glycerol phosphate synthase subunit HisH [Rhodospirillaceae bacterium]|nr:imidazole glycerol phosphate synthase subunit HisH [Rhodospirillaceae bacterium]|tara:strand:- start:1379 stop:2029 length:651 start_codon:yes stop_codon:yes gene_type:complete
MSLIIIDYGSGNLRSAAKAFQKVADGKTKVSTSSCPEAVAKSDYVVLPGVGTFPDCKKGLSALPGMIDSLQEHIVVRGRPFLGICVGMQLTASMGHELTQTRGLDWFSASVCKIDFLQNEDAHNNLKVPHMGWNQLKIKRRGHPVLDGISEDLYFYFAHSFHMQLDNNNEIMATTEYGGPITAMVGRDNVLGTQFHPEKSQAAGLQMLENFLKWRP